MPRVKIGAARRRKKKKVMKAVRGQYGARSKQYRTAKTARMRSEAYAFVGRKQKKRDYRALWITRINAALDGKEVSYSRFMNGLKKAKVEINRKQLSELAIDDPDAFGELITLSKKALA